jgi:hypothetical protein
MAEDQPVTKCYMMPQAWTDSLGIRLRIETSGRLCGHSYLPSGLIKGKGKVVPKGREFFD